MAEFKKDQQERDTTSKADILKKERERALRRYRNYYSNSAIINRAARENLTEK